MKSLNTSLQRPATLVSSSNGSGRLSHPHSLFHRSVKALALLVLSARSGVRADLTPAFNFDLSEFSDSVPGCEMAHQPDPPSTKSEQLRKWAGQIEVKRNSAQQSGMLGLGGRPKQVTLTREDLSLKETDHLHVDFGGEGYHVVDCMEAGFKGALNVNAQIHDSQDVSKPIPNLVQLDDWSTNPVLPFAANTVDRVTMQGAPLTEHNVAEISRVVRPGGTVELWIDSDAFAANIQKLADSLGSEVVHENGKDCENEQPSNSWEKICLTKAKSQNTQHEEF